MSSGASSGDKAIGGVGFIGAGNMAYAMAGRLAASDLMPAADVVACDLDAKRRELFKSEGMSATGDAAEVVRRCRFVFLAVKPQHFESVLKPLRQQRDQLKDKIFVSIAAGLPLSLLLKSVPRCVRLMPNTPALVGQMYGAYALSDGFDAKDRADVARVLKAMGHVHEVSEDL